MYSPAEHQIAQVQRETGMDRMQAINHLRQREAVRLNLQNQRLQQMRRLTDRVFSNK